MHDNLNEWPGTVHHHAVNCHPMLAITTSPHCKMTLNTYLPSHEQLKSRKASPGLMQSTLPPLLMYLTDPPLAIHCQISLHPKAPCPCTFPHNMTTSKKTLKGVLKNVKIFVFFNMFKIFKICCKTSVFNTFCLQKNIQKWLFF